MTANEHRGEIPIRLNGKDFVMRPTWQAIVEIETATGRGIVEISQLIASGMFGLTLAGHIVTAGLKAGGEKEAKFDKVLEMLFATGIGTLGKPLDQFLSAALTGGQDPGEAKAAEQT